MEKYNFPAEWIYNVNETGLTIVQSKCSEIISLKGKRQVSTLTSAERGSLVTAILYMSADGIFVPPLLIYPRKNMSAQLQKGASSGTIFACHPSGWIQTAIVTDWFKHILAKVKPSRDDPVLFIGRTQHSWQEFWILEAGQREQCNNIMFATPYVTQNATIR